MIFISGYLSRKMVDLAVFGRMPLIFILIALFFSYGVYAGEAILWNDLNAQQQSILMPLKSDWQTLPVERRKKLNDITRRWDQLPSEKKEKIQQRMQHWANMSPEEKRKFQERRKKFQSLPPEERARIKQKYKSYKICLLKNRRKYASNGKINRHMITRFIINSLQANNKLKVLCINSPEFIKVS